MDHYQKFLRRAQETYFSAVVKKTFNDAKCWVTRTNWDGPNKLGFMIEGTVHTNNRVYDAEMKEITTSIKPYDTRYGFLVLKLTNKTNTKEQITIIVNPATLKSDYNLNKIKSEEFIKELAFWAESFESDSYTCPKDGRTAPEILDVIITYCKKNK